MSKFFKALILSGMAVALFAVPSFGATYVVDAGGSPNTYPTLAAAFAEIDGLCNPGDNHRVEIWPGAYTDEDLVVPVCVFEITGLATGDAVFTGTGSDFLNLIPGGRTTGLTVHYLKLTGYDRAFDVSGDWTGLGLTLEFNSIDPCVYGVMLDGSTVGVTVDQNEIFDCSYGVYCAGNGNTITNNNIHDNTAYGAYATGTPNDWHGNCFIDNAVQAYASVHQGALKNEGNYYNDWDGTGGGYLWAGAGADLDSTPLQAGVTIDYVTPMDLFDTQVVTFQWNEAGCYADKGLVGYEFTVHYDVTYLAVVAGSAGFNLGIFGDPDPAFYDVYTNVPGEVKFVAANYEAPFLGDGDLCFVTFEALAPVDPGTVLTLSSNYKMMGHPPSSMSVAEGTATIVIEDNVVPWFNSAALTNTTVSDGVGVPVFDAGTQCVLEVTGEVEDDWDLDRIQYRFDDGSEVNWTNLVTGLSGGDNPYAFGPTVISTAGLSADGAHDLELRVRDAELNWSVVTVLPFTLDRTPPTVDAFVVVDPNGCAVAGYTNELPVEFQVTNTLADAVNMEWSVGFGWSGIEPFQTAFTQSLVTANGASTCYIRLYDACGNGSVATTFGIMHDDVAPSPSGFAITPAYTTTLTVAWTLAAYNEVPAGIQLMGISENATDLDDCTNPVYVASPGSPAPYTTGPYTFTSYTDEALNSLYLAVIDLAGNISAALTDDVFVDLNPPVCESVTLTDNSDDEEDCTNDASNIKVAVDHDDNPTNYRVRFSTVSDTGPWTAWENLNGDPSNHVVNFTTAGGFTCDDDNTLWVMIRDNANNQTVCFDDIFIDCTTPTWADGSVEDLDYVAPGMFSGPLTGYTNSMDINIKFTGSADIEAIYVDENGNGPVRYDAFSIVTGVIDTFVFPYTINTIADLCGNPVVNFDIYAVDCAGKMTTTWSPSITGDDPACTAPDITAFTCDAFTNDLTVNVNYTVTDDIAMNGMQFYDEFYGADSGTGWMAYAAGPYAYSIADDGVEGSRNIVVEFTDVGGNMSTATAAVDVDMTAPTCDITIVSNNPLSLPGYTDSKIVDVLFTNCSADVDKVRFRNSCGAFGSWVPIADLDDWNLDCGGACGTRTMVFRFRDFAMNVSADITADIDYCNIAPSAPGVTEGIPVQHSLYMTWVPPSGDIQSYMIRAIGTNEYACYTTGDPCFPDLPTDGWLVADGITANEYTMSGPATQGWPADIYAISIFPLDNWGIYGAPNQDLMEVNYLAGDFNLDGEIDFTNDIMAFAGIFNDPTAIDGIGDDCEYDIGPTHNMYRGGLPRPDGVTNLEDVMIMLMNYYCQWDGNCPKDPAPKVTTEPFAVFAELPEYLPANTEYTVSLNVENADVIAGFHLVFDYDQEKLELVSVEKGSMYETGKTFFHVGMDVSSIDITGASFDLDAAPAGDELAQITFRTKTPGPLVITDREVDVRNAFNQSLDVAFSNVPTAGTVIPDAFALSQNYPNPFNPATTIELSLPVASEYSLTIYNIAGQVVQEFSGYHEAGIFTVTWDASDVSSGIYLYKMEASDYSATKKMVLLK